MRTPQPHPARWRLPIVRRDARRSYDAHSCGACFAPLRVGEDRGGSQENRSPQVLSDGSVFFFVRRISAESCAKIHAEHAVMIPTHRKVA
jgi:hypothetical protein